jgi:general secretion pathway protein D
MAMIINKFKSAILVIFASLLMGSFSPMTPQEPGLQPDSERERQRTLERLTGKMRQAQQEITQAVGTATQKPAVPGTAASPAPAGAQVATPAPATAPIPIPPPRESGRVQLSYESVDLYDFINQIASTLGLTPILIDPDVKGSVTIQSSAPMSKEDVLPLFNMVLKNNNAALIKQDNIYQIVPISSALKRGIEVLELLPSAPAVKPDQEKTPDKIPEAAPAKTVKTPMGVVKTAPVPSASQPIAKAQNAGPAAQSSETGISRPPRLATHVIRVEFIPVKDLIEPVKLFMTEGGVIMPYDRLNMLIITDYTDSAARVLEIIRMLDNSYLDPDLVELIKINNNASADLCEDLKKIFGSGAKDSATGISFVSLERLNAVFVMASSKRALEEAKRWIKELDSATGRNIQTYVYVVENSTASNIAMMLTALYGGEGSTAGTTGGTGGTYTGGAYGRSQTGGTQAGAFGSGGSTMSGSAQTGGTGVFGGSSSYQGSRSGQGGYQSGYDGGSGGGYYGGGGVFGGGGRQLGPRLNTTPTITSQTLQGGAFSGLQDIVRLVVDDVNNSLIIQATQVDYTLLLETIKKMDVLPRQVIIDARIFEVDLTDTLAFGVSATLQGVTTDPHLTTASIGPLGALSASTFAFVGDSREILMNLNALRQKTNVRILEAPSVLALDGTEARIVVGSEIPYPGTSFTPSVGGTTTSVQYRDTGVSLLIQPRISASGSVTLVIAQEVSSPGAPTDDGPTFAKSSVETTLSVKDGETVAIAGLIRESKGLTRNGVPLLSDIPILGYLFGTTRRTANRSELIILITPHVIRTPEKFQEMTQELKDSLRNARKWADENEKEHLEDMEDARDDRYKQEQERLKKTGQPNP